MELLTKYKVDKDFSRKVLKSIRFQNKILDIMSNAPERKDIIGANIKKDI